MVRAVHAVRYRGLRLPRHVRLLMARGLSSLSLLVLGVAICGCGVGRTAASSAPVETLPSDGGDYFGVAWLPGGQIVIGESVGPAHGSTRFATVDRATGFLTDITIPRDPRCWRELATSPRALPDGRLGFVHVCRHSIDSSPPDDESIEAIALDSGFVTHLFDIGPLGELKNPQFTLDPTMDRAIYEIGAGACGDIAVATAHSKADTVDALVTGDGKQFNLNEGPSTEIGCTSAGRAAGPAMSPDGSVLGFLGSPASVGVGGAADRRAAPWHVYELPAGTSTPESFSAAITFAGALAWSPDGKRLAFIGDVSGRGTGIWLLNPSEGSLAYVGQPTSTRIAWSPDSRSIVTILLDAQSDLGTLAIVGPI
jgi:hypothetical protein